MIKKTGQKSQQLLLLGLAVCLCWGGVSCMIENRALDYYGGMYLPGNNYYPGEETFAGLSFNPFVDTTIDNLATFGVDVDTGSYTFGINKIGQGILPPPESVRVEEYINYFNQDYLPPVDEHPFAVYTDGTVSLFRENLYILRIGLKGRVVAPGERKRWNLTFLVDVSGSMESRLDLVKESLLILLSKMQPGDKLSLCTYAGSVKTLLTPTQVDNKQKIRNVINSLIAGGSTAMGSGIVRAYKQNTNGFITGGVNRVIVCSDGDANVGSASHEEILDMIKNYVARGITLTTMGFGNGNYNDQMMEQLANKGNGNYYYINNLREARRLFSTRLLAMMEVIAKDVKIQVEFNQEVVKSYRLLGYENRSIDDEDFTDEATDAGEIGSGHDVTALFEVELNTPNTMNLGTVHLRYKLPEGETDILMDKVIPADNFVAAFKAAPDSLQFTSLVAEFAEILRGSPYVETEIQDLCAPLEDAVDFEDDLEVEFIDFVNKALTAKADSMEYYMLD